MPMSKITCPICNNEPDKFFRKSGVLYSQCASCKTVFCDTLDQEGKVGGEFEVERNEKENHIRIARINEMCADIPLEERRILDFGAGNGHLIEDLKREGYIHVDGFDAYNEKYQRLPGKERYHLVTMIEVIEHLSHPFIELDVIYKSLVNYGCVMIETGSVNVAAQENIPIEEYFYVSPEAGHSTIFSHHGLDVLMCLKGFTPRQHFNRHVFTFQKLNK